MKIQKRNVINVNDWDELVEETYGKIYSFQQQDDCKDRGIETIYVSEEEVEDNEHDEIPEVINSEIMGIKFNIWLARDPKAPLNPTDEQIEECSYYWGKTEEDKEEWKNNTSHINLFWERNFYPNVNVLAHDLYKRGLIEAGEYDIKIDW